MTQKEEREKKILIDSIKFAMGQLKVTNTDGEENLATDNIDNLPQME